MGTHTGAKGRASLLLLVTALVGYCSIVYELILAQCLSIALGNTIVRYSMTIGLYLFSLGLGSLSLYFYPPRNTIRALLWAEVSLAAIGLFLPGLLVGGDHFIHQWFPHGTISPQTLSWGLMHLFVVLIGVLSGVEVPLLMGLARDHSKDEESAKANEIKVLAVDYLATFAGAVSFPWFIYQGLGLVAGAALVAFLNAFAAFLMLVAFTPSWLRHPYFTAAVALCLALAGLIFVKEQAVRETLIAYIFAPRSP